jgi:FAD/FMN-containing dehydrogenase
MPDVYLVDNPQQAQQAWQEIINTGKRPYPLGNGSGSADPLPSPTIKLGGELASIHHINIADRQVVAGCGVTIAMLERELSAAGLCFPAKVFDPIKVSLGGWLGSGMPGSGGCTTPVRRLLAATLITPQGRLIRSGAATPKDVAGYDFHRPLIGAFGRLGMLLEATLAVDVLPAQSQLMRLITDKGVLLFEQIDRCKTLERLWVSKISNNRMEIMVELCGNPESIKLDSQLLGLIAEDNKILVENTGEFWSGLLYDSFIGEGYYLRRALPTAQACTKIAEDGWWGNPREGRIWRYLGTNQPLCELSAGQMVFKRMGEKLFPISDIKSVDSNSYIANV